MVKLIFGTRPGAIGVVCAATLVWVVLALFQVFVGFDPHRIVLLKTLWLASCLWVGTVSMLETFMAAHCEGEAHIVGSTVISAAAILLMVSACALLLYGF